MCHLHSYSLVLTIDEVEEMLSTNKGIHIAFMSINGNFYVSTKIKGDTITIADYFKEVLC